MCATAVLPRVTSVYGTMSSLSVAVRSLYPKNSVTVSTARALAVPRGAALGQAYETTVHLVPPQRRTSISRQANSMFANMLPVFAAMDGVNVSDGKTANGIAEYPDEEPTDKVRPVQFLRPAAAFPAPRGVQQPQAPAE